MRHLKNGLKNGECVPVAITNIHQNEKENQKRTKELVALVQASIKVYFFANRNPNKNNQQYF